MLPAYKFTAQYAQNLDEADALHNYAKLFHIPKQPNGNLVHYFCGNSLGLQPVTTREYIADELTDWANLGVEGHFEGKNPWFYYHHFLTQATANLVGAKPHEVVVMNALTVNLHLLMASFYRPTPQRYKIIIESPAFPSDKYAVASQAAFHGFDPHDAVIEIQPLPGENTLTTQQICATINQHKDTVALVLFGAVNYYTGQWFEMEKITQAAHAAGAYAGWDCAHATGNVPLLLNQWGVDFAAWCGYKYLNSGPGGVSGVFVHEKHGLNTQNPLPRFAGWWGNDEKQRFTMPPNFEPQAGAAGWQLSNAPVLPMAAHRAALEIFDRAGIENLRTKSIQLTNYVDFCIAQINAQYPSNLPPPLQIITPNDTAQRGCQLSILTQPDYGRQLFDYLTQQGIIADWRQPNVIRVAPVPLYNTFADVYALANALQNGLRQFHKTI